jgi:hypothetical protein
LLDVLQVRLTSSKSWRRGFDRGGYFSVRKTKSGRKRESEGEHEDKVETRHSLKTNFKNLIFFFFFFLVSDDMSSLSGGGDGVVWDGGVMVVGWWWDGGGDGVVWDGGVMVV